MNNIRKSLLVLFQNQNPNKMLKKLLSNNYMLDESDYILDKSSKISSLLDKNDFITLFQYENNSLYNKDEVLNLCNLLENNWNSKKNIHSIVMKFAKDILEENEGKPVCQFENLLRWRELSFQLGEDLFTTAYFAEKDFENNYKRNYFSWPSIISTNNNRIKEILKKGTAENHFHLNGSSPHFQLSWISLMNNVNGREKEFEKLKKNKRLYPVIQSTFDENVEKIDVLVLKAAIIRMYLYEICILKNDKKRKELGDYLKESEIFISKTDLQSKIDALKYIYGKKLDKEIPDYIIPKNINSINFNNNTKYHNGNILLYGERYFLYSVFKYILQVPKDKVISEVFYIYLCIKQSFRNEIIQVNRVVGFSNFADYQDRKEDFLKEGSIYEKAVVNLAINSSLVDQNIKFLETRIAPKNTKKAYIDSLKKIKIKAEDTAIFDRYSKEDKLLQKLEKKEESKNEKGEYFHTIHFIKKVENKNKSKNYELLNMITPRNFKVREDILKQAITLNDVRKSTEPIVGKVYGIDAANVEIGCRPEVFGQIFRYLKNYKPINLETELGLNFYREIGKTYHVGEDFLDIVDGLRAIDESILFLNLSHGDRLGHALALGIDPVEYYETKEGVVLLPKQILLDNIAWLLYKKNELNIEISVCLNNKLLSLFNKYYREIYMQKSNLNLENICVNSYIDSWKLRGDAPEIYLDENNLEEIDTINIDIFDRFKLNNLEVVQDARKNMLAKRLYREYHYNSNVKNEGDLVVEFKIDFDILQLINKVQFKMQEEIARKNLSVETNPSSNYLISTFDKYVKHPIVRFYNNGLESKKQCNQMHVSINTDDQGVFATCLENEYALMALALLKEKDENCEYVYNQNAVYNWLDKIREMGLEQSFINRYKR